MTNSWDGLIINLIATNNLTMELTVSTLLSKETRKKSSSGSLGDAIMVRDRFMEQGDSERSIEIRVKVKEQVRVGYWH